MLYKGTVFETQLLGGDTSHISTPSHKYSPTLKKRERRRERERQRERETATETETEKAQCPNMVLCRLKIGQGE